MRSFLFVASTALSSAVAALVVACSSDSTGTAAQAESVKDASTSTSTPAEWIPGNHGGYLYLRYADERLSVVASFFQIPGGRVCSTTTSGPCVLTDCTAGAGDGDAADGLSDPAGTISVTGGAIPAGYQARYENEGTYEYKETPVTGAPWNIGDPITFKATGEWVPAFTTTVPAPALGASVVVADAGAADAGEGAGVITVDRTQPYTVAWTGAAGGKINLQIQTEGSAERAVSAMCTFDAAAGTGTVPAPVMAKMVAGPGRTLLYPASDTTVVAGQYTVNVSVQSGATNGSSAITFQ